MARADLNVRPLHDRILVRRMAEEEKQLAGSSSPIQQKRNPSAAKSLRPAKAVLLKTAKFCRLKLRSATRFSSVNIRAQS